MMKLLKSQTKTMSSKEREAASSQGSGENLIPTRRGEEQEVILEGEERRPLEPIPREEIGRRHGERHDGIGYERKGTNFERRMVNYDQRSAEFEMRMGDFDEHFGYEGRRDNQATWREHPLGEWEVMEETGGTEEIRG
ncbi:hypothetical protein MA16_Dca024085 [Dendrobium catenatum]|uniref:Uncharacterized protein n=1 Tax=Dendrobium catenatum TaxID=906689 RepID=A0A2I0VQU6_9ASPA|nr:hypothetical protein MA16_Dca024085 [Dendrobium catenatum]